VRNAKPKSAASSGKSRGIVDAPGAYVFGPSWAFRDLSSLSLAYVRLPVGCGGPRQGAPPSGLRRVFVRAVRFAAVGDEGPESLIGGPVPNRFAVAVPTQAPKALYVTAAVSASLGRPTRFGPATVRQASLDPEEAHVSPT
jgi:hypothetical protein